MTDSSAYFPPPSFHEAGGFGGAPLPYPYPFDPSVPPPPLGCPPPVGYPPSPFSPQVHTNYGPGYGVQRSDFRLKQDYQEFSSSGPHFFRGKENDQRLGPSLEPQLDDETTTQRKQDQQWLRKFLQDKEKLSKNPPSPQPQQISVTDTREALYRTAQLVTQLSASCEALKLNMDNQSVWTDSYLKALGKKREIQLKLKVLSDSECLQRLKTKLSNIAKRRARRLRARNRLQMEEQQKEALIAEKEAAIDKWRMKKMHEVEEKKKERELKLAADSVLCEVRKKQADVKRMHDILKSLEKLRKLRKEAASRKGIFTERVSDEAFENLLEKLRSVLKKRTVVYSAEENALMVMLEGEQQEERRRDLERRQKKEREKQLLRKQRVDAMLFGDDIPADPLMQPFRQYYTQAEQSLPALVQIRREWDIFLVAADHPEGSSVPQDWVLPDAPSDQTWASALQTSDTECVDI